MDLTIPRCLGPGHPVLDSVLPVIAESKDVTTDAARVHDVAQWLAYEELPFPRFLLPFAIELDRDRMIDFILVASLPNFAYTDFETGVRFDQVVDGAVYADSDALLYCLHRAVAEGVDVLDGAYLAQVTTDDLRRLFRGGTTELQMLDERAAILRDAGATLVERYDGQFHNLVAAASPALYDDRHGLLELLVRDFPRFDDVAEYNGHTVRFYKLAQLAVWFLEVSLPGGLGLSDMSRLTAFADYIVPVGLRVLGIFRYSDPLEAAIAGGVLIDAGSPWEVELRAHTIYATALLTDEVNALRPPELQVIVPQIDARFWVPFHKTHWPHHLTRTIFY
ncbi:MAG: queuosine salvage family protein [Gaiellaceae bacterium]